MKDFFIKKGDLLQEIQVDFQNSDGTPIDLTSASVKFSMVNCETDAVKVNAATATIVTPTLGRVKYTWSGTDTDTAGQFRGEFEATIGGKKLTAPNNGHIPVRILADLG